MKPTILERLELARTLESIRFEMECLPEDYKETMRMKRKDWLNRLEAVRHIAASDYLAKDFALIHFAVLRSDLTTIKTTETA